MLDRLLKLIVALTLLLFLAQALIGLLAGALAGLLGGLTSGIGALGALALAATLLCLAVGLVVRSSRFLVARDPRVASERAARERAGRTRVRRPAKDAPVHQPEEPPADPDPAINDEDG